MSENFEIEWPDSYFDRREVETPCKGWLEVNVRFEGERYSLLFYDPVRLQQEAMDAFEAGQNVFAEPNWILVAKVTTEAIRVAVGELIASGYFLKRERR